MPPTTSVDLAQLTDFYRLAGLRIAGRASGRNLLEWPMGRFSQHHGEGQIAIAPLPGVTMMPPSLDALRGADVDHAHTSGARSRRRRSLAHLPVAGR